MHRPQALTAEMWTVGSSTSHLVGILHARLARSVLKQGKKLFLQDTCPVRFVSHNPDGRPIQPQLSTPFALRATVAIVLHVRRKNNGKRKEISDSAP